MLATQASQAQAAKIGNAMACFRISIHNPGRGSSVTSRGTPANTR